MMLMNKYINEENKMKKIFGIIFIVFLIVVAVGLISAGDVIIKDGDLDISSDNLFVGGNVGIGTTIPSDLLHILASGTASAKVRVQNSNRVWSSGILDSGSNFVIRDESAGTTQVTIGAGAPANSLVVGGSGVGIGTTNPAGDLHIERSSGDPDIKFTDVSQGSFMLGMPDGTNGFEIAAGNALGTNSRLRIDSSGNVGIGTAAPGSRLDVYSATNPTTLRIGGLALTPNIDTSALDFYAANAGTPTYARIGMGFTDAGVGTQTGYLAFSTINSGTLAEKMRITNSGNVGIGTTNPGTSKLYVNGKITAVGGVDPPYVSFSAETHESIREFAKNVEEHEKVMVFWNTKNKQMEVYVISEDKFYTLDGKLIRED